MHNVCGRSDSRKSFADYTSSINVEETIGIFARNCSIYGEVILKPTKSWRKEVAILIFLETRLVRFNLDETGTEAISILRDRYAHVMH